jgi:gliding motility-associated-like protein
MKFIITIILLGINIICYSQQSVELCDTDRKTFTYYSTSDMIGSWIWFLNGDIVSTESSANITWNTPGKYELEVQFSKLCTSKSEVYKIEVTECAKPTIYFSNSFSPNKDNKNEVWRPKGQNIKEIKWTIWNRLGEMIYSADDMLDSWDGTYQGVDAQEDVYYFMAEWKDLKEIPEQKIGFIVLIR